MSQTSRSASAWEWARNRVAKPEVVAVVGNQVVVKGVHDQALFRLEDSQDVAPPLQFVAFGD